MLRVGLQLCALFQVEENWNPRALREGSFLFECTTADVLMCLSVCLWSGSQVEGIVPLKKEHGCHPPFPRQCHACDEERFIMAQLGAFIIYSL